MEKSLSTFISDESPSASGENKLELIKKYILNGLINRSTSGYWIWHIFLMCFIPGILNGLHVSSYVFIGQMPDDYWCEIGELTNERWTTEEMINISTIFNNDIRLERHGCNIFDLNYTALSEMSYEEAFSVVQSLPIPPTTIKCLNRQNNRFYYEQEEGISIVTEWDLICDNSIRRTEAQSALALGKLIGAFIFGVLSDKFGRRTSFIISAVIYIICGPVAAFIPWYAVFILARVGIGIAGNCYHTAYVILNEIASEKNRSWMSIFYSAGYPLGMIILSLIAYNIHNWRSLQFFISLPAIILIYHCFALVESPRWLLNQNRLNDAYKIVFKQKISPEEYTTLNLAEIDNKLEIYEEINDYEKSKWGQCIEFVKNIFKELSSLYGTHEMRKRALICHFAWCAASLSYYAIALNAENFSTDRYIYVALTGLVEIPSYIIPIVILHYLGRRATTQMLFTIGGVSLLIILAIPQEIEIATVTIAMLGRLCISAVYAVVILYTADLFPTEIRSSAIGTSSTFSHVGSIAAPYIVDLLGEIKWYIPTTICAGVALIAALLTIGLPETKGKNITDTIKEEVE